MRVKTRLYALAAAGVFWVASILLTLQTELLQPYYQYHRSYGLLVFIAAQVLLCAGYAIGQASILGLPRAHALTLALLCGAAIELLLLFLDLKPVMLAELVTNRLFYFYFLGLSSALAVAFTFLSGYLIVQTVSALRNGSIHPILVLLPIALLTIYPHTSYLPWAVAAAISIGLWQYTLKTRFGQLSRHLDRFTRLKQWFYDDRVFGCGLIAGAFLLRAAYAIRIARLESVHGFVWDDAIIYENGARDLSYEGYSLFLRGVYSVFGHSFVAVGIVQSVIGAGTCLVVFLMARDLLGRRVARLTAILCVIFGTLLFLPAMHARETLLSFGLVTSVYAAFKLKKGPLSRDILLGIALGLLAFLKVILFPIALLVAFYRWKLEGGPRSSAIVPIVIAAVIIATKFVANRPLNVPVGQSVSEYAALAYFAGNHPFSREEQWFNLSQRDYSQLKTLGFNVGDGAGDPGIIVAWKEKYPRIAYCDKVTFETNTWKLLRYNFSHPRRLVTTHLENLVAFFLGVFRHHRLFDPVFLLNQSAFSMVFRIYWLALLGVGSAWAWITFRNERAKRAKLLLIGFVILYFVVVHTLIIGTTVYSIPITPFMLILQSMAMIKIYDQARDQWAVSGRRAEQETIS